MYKYGLTKGEYIVEGISHVGYGITLKSDVSQCAVFFSDITLDRDKAARFVYLCSIFQLSPIHLSEITVNILSCGFAE